MNRSKDIEAEWIELAPGVAAKGFSPVPYRVPEGYFHGFYDRLMMVIRTAEEGGFNRDFSVDGADDLSASEEIGSISPLLAGLSRKMPYQVPDDYFTQFRVSEDKAAGIVAGFDTAFPLEAGIQISPAEGTSRNSKGMAPVIKLKRRSGWMRIAAAACVTAVILTAAFFYLNPTQTATVAGQLAQVSDQDMLSYMDNHEIPLGNPVDSATLASDANGPQSFNESDISDLMSNVSDDELEHYYASTDAQDTNLN